MKSDLEIQRAHDLLRATEEIFERSKASDLFPFLLRAAADVLCWVLDHESAFTETIQQVEADLIHLGVQLVDSGKLNYPDGKGRPH